MGFVQERSPVGKKEHSRETKGEERTGEERRGEDRRRKEGMGELSMAF